MVRFNHEMMVKSFIKLPPKNCKFYKQYTLLSITFTELEREAIYWIVHHLPENISQRAAGYQLLDGVHYLCPPPIWNVKTCRGRKEKKQLCADRSDHWTSHKAVWFKWHLGHSYPLPKTYLNISISKELNSDGKLCWQGKEKTNKKTVNHFPSKTQNRR